MCACYCLERPGMSHRILRCWITAFQFIRFLMVLSSKVVNLVRTWSNHIDHRIYPLSRHRAPSGLTVLLKNKIEPWRVCLREKKKREEDEQEIWSTENKTKQKKKRKHGDVYEGPIAKPMSVKLGCSSLSFEISQHFLIWCCYRNKGSIEPIKAT